LPLKISLPIGLQASIISIGLIVLQKSLNGFGPEAVGGYAIAQKLDIMATLPIASIGIAMATFAAQNYGAGLYSRIWEGVRISLLLTFVYSIVLGGALLYFGTDIIRLLFKQNDPAVLAYAHTYFIATASFYLVLATLIILRYTLQGVGDNTAPTFGGVMEMVARVLVPLGFSGLLGYQAVAFANPVAWVGAAVPMMYAYRQLKRKLTLLEEKRC
ncbi:MAG TPA: MATE family efflux transporter, partial [Trichococcus flocculiformis]|nr:MATE family efflux transporter [Trichococcus flocculiformis]